MKKHQSRRRNAGIHSSLHRKSKDQIASGGAGNRTFSAKKGSKNRQRKKKTNGNEAIGAIVSGLRGKDHDLSLSRSFTDMMKKSHPKLLGNARFMASVSDFYFLNTKDESLPREVIVEINRTNGSMNEEEFEMLVFTLEGIKTIILENKRAVPITSVKELDYYFVAKKERSRNRFQEEAYRGREEERPINRGLPEPGMIDN